MSVDFVSGYNKALIDACRVITDNYQKCIIQREIDILNLTMQDPKIINQPGGPDDVWTFEIPTYKVTNEGLQDGEGMTLKLCRGNSQDENAPRQEGVFSETLIMAVKTYLEKVNAPGPLSTRETSMAITKLDEALLWMQKRSDDRKRRQVQGTYQK